MVGKRRQAGREKGVVVRKTRICGSKGKREAAG